MKKEFALYKGDTFIMIGTKDEIAKHQGVSRRTIDHMATPTYKKRVKNNGIIIIPVEEE